MLLPSYAEGLPIKIMEAIAIGRPVLTTTIAGIPEGRWHMRLNFHEHAIAEALRGVMRASPPERASLGQEGSRRVEERHDLRKFAQALLEPFIGVLEQRGR